jgi:hypothetical protein
VTRTHALERLADLVYVVVAADCRRSNTEGIAHTDSDCLLLELLDALLELLEFCRLLALLNPFLLALRGLLRCKCVAATATSFAAAPAVAFGFSSALAFAAALSSRCVKSVAFVVLGGVAVRFLMTSPATPAALRLALALVVSCLLTAVAVALYLRTLVSASRSAWVAVAVLPPPPPSHIVIPMVLASSLSRSTDALHATADA